jgi:hypothetical protein
LCENADEAVVYNHLFGDLSILDDDADFSFYIDQNNGVYGVNAAQHHWLAKGHYLIRATGQQAKLLRKWVLPNVPAQINIKIQSSAGPLVLVKGMYLVNGGPSLLVDGKQNIAVRATQGWTTKINSTGKTALDDNDQIDSGATQSQSRSNFYHNWVINRHPRTAVGITKNKDVYIVVVYGRNPGISAGASVTEMADIMQSLGAIKAINFDGGGSSVMIIDGHATGRPSDKSGERLIGDALLLLPPSASQ